MNSRILVIAVCACGLMLAACVHRSSDGDAAVSKRVVGVWKLAPAGGTGTAEFQPDGGFVVLPFGPTGTARWTGRWYVSNGVCSFSLTNVPDAQLPREGLTAVGRLSPDDGNRLLIPEIGANGETNQVVWVRNQ